MFQAEKKVKKKTHPFLLRFGIGKEIDYFLENLASLLAAGIPILDALASMRAEVRSRKLGKIIEEMSENVENGESLSYTLEESGLFSSHVSVLLRMGERSGKLVENLKIIAAEEQKRRALTSKIRSAVMYPVFIMSLMLVMGVGIAWFILPKLATVFSQFDISLPLVTKILISFGRFLGSYGTYAVPAFFLMLGLVVYVVFFFSKTKVIGEHVLFFLPGSKTLLKQNEIARFGYLLGTLLSAGLSPVESVRSLSEATSFSRYRRFYLYLSESITEGNSFKKSFALYRGANTLVPVFIQQLIIASEQSGHLSDTLLKIGETYETKVDTTTKDFAVMIEPVLLVIVGLGVLAIALAVILPVYGLMRGISTG